MKVEVFYSLQSDYCYFLLDRLVKLSRKGVDVAIRPVLGGVIRIPERYQDRDALEQQYFRIDTVRTAAHLGLPYAYPEPSPIRFKPESLWISKEEQPLNEYLNRLYVGSVMVDRGIDFLNVIGRMLWDGSAPGWNEGNYLANGMRQIGMELESVLKSTPWSTARKMLNANAESMLNAGHWGVPLMVYDGEPFYGQDRFDQLVWRMGKDHKHNLQFEI